MGGLVPNLVTHVGAVRYEVIAWGPNASGSSWVLVAWRRSNGSEGMWFYDGKRYVHEREEGFDSLEETLVRLRELVDDAAS
jgi:hypothetical protein